MSSAKIEDLGEAMPDQDFTVYWTNKIGKQQSATYSAETKEDAVNSAKKNIIAYYHASIEVSEHKDVELSANPAEEDLLMDVNYKNGAETKEGFSEKSITNLSLNIDSMNPTPEQIKQTRKDAGLTQTQAAELIYKARISWQQYESGARQMDRALFELFMIKAGKP